MASIICHPCHCWRNCSYLFQTVVSHYCRCTPRGVWGVKRPEILWEIPKYSLSGWPSSKIKSKTIKKCIKIAYEMANFFDSTQWWVNGRPGFGFLTIFLRPLDLYPQCLLEMKSPSVALVEIGLTDLLKTRQGGLSMTPSPFPWLRQPWEVCMVVLHTTM